MDISHHRNATTANKPTRQIFMDDGLLNSPNVPPRVRSVDRLDLLMGESLNSPSAPLPSSEPFELKQHTPQLRAVSLSTPGIAIVDSPTSDTLQNINFINNGPRPSSPLLRMIANHPELSSPTYFTENMEVMTAREAPKTAPSRSKSNVEAISAPVTARETSLNAGLQISNDQGVGGALLPSSSHHHPYPPSTTHSSSHPPRRDSRPSSLSLAHSSSQTLTNYIVAELHPGPSYPTADVVWGQTERDRVYNALLAVPYQLERLIWLGIAICTDSFLSVFTLLPVRVLGALISIASYIMSTVFSSLNVFGMFKSRKETSHVGVKIENEKSKKMVFLRGDQIYDLICASMFAIVVLFLWNLKAGSIYYWVKDLTQEFLKLSVLQTALELSDKICCSFLVDVLEALAASCTAFAANNRISVHNALNVASDALIALFLLVWHGTTLMAQALVFGVAMNSQKNTLLALLIASNFTEIKGTVLKRFDPTKIFVLTSQDVVERFHLLIVLAFVLVEEMSGTGSTVPSVRLLFQCGYVLLAEVVIDVIKHAVLGKFNEIRPGVYREFTKDLCEQLVTSQSHTSHKLVGFEPFGPAALFFRVFMSYAALRKEDPKANAVWAQSVPWSVLALVGAWFLLAAFKVGLGFIIKKGAFRYMKRYEARRAGMRTRSRGVTFDNTTSISTSSNTTSVLHSSSSKGKKDQ